MIFGEKIKLKVYVNQHDSVSDIQTPSRSWFLLCFLHRLLMISQAKNTVLYAGNKQLSSLILSNRLNGPFAL
jgi:hypothetical protein